MQDLRWRCIGPPRGGRVVAVAGDPKRDMVFYFGAVAGGVFKTTDGGTYWENVSDGYFKTASVGALAVAQSDPNVIYAGMGETTIRLDVSYGDGVYKSTDAGRSWNHVGLAETRHIGEIRIHPDNPDLVYVAALGHAFGPNSERGVFRSQDGGRNWQKILYRSDRAGAVDLAIDPNNPRLLFAAIWQAQRNFWSLSSGGPDSGLYRSTDGGDSWSPISQNKGFPEGIKGKIGVAVSPAQDQRVWAIVEAEKAGLYLSDDGGQTWDLVCDNRDLLHRPWYFMHVFADPKDAQTVYVTNLNMFKSTDAGRHFSQITTPHGDNHDLWIDPRNPHRMIEGNDGGACVSFNGGRSWSTIYNQLTSQLYRIDIDNQFPYRVYATQQDNASISVPSATEYGAIAWADCYPTGTGESGFIAVNPEDSNIVYIGAVGSSPGGSGPLQRYDHRTKQLRLVSVWPEEYFGAAPGDLKYRFAWTYPIVFSPHDAGVLYACGNRAFRTLDEGSSWEPISPDLSRADPKTLEVSGGPLTTDASGAEHYGTICTFVESAHTKGVFWAGSDDGLIHLSRDGGASWQDVTPPDLEPWSLVGSIEVSPRDPATAYAAATRYKLDEYRPMLFKTEDFGQSWRSINGDFPDGQITRVLRADPVTPSLLYVGTETGVMVSTDDGQHWRQLPGGLPVVPVYDLKVKQGDLVAATHGRSLWILDDLTPLRHSQAQVDAKMPVHLYPPLRTIRRWQHWSVNVFRAAGKNYMPGLGAAAAFYEQTSAEGHRTCRYLDAGESPPQGVIVYYLLHEAPAEPLRLTFLDTQGQTIKSFTSPTQPAPPPPPDDQDESPPGKPDRFAPARAGLNRFVWDMRYPDAEPLDERLQPAARSALAPRPKPANGALAPPGTYQVRIEACGQVVTASFQIAKAPGVKADQEDLQAQFQLWCRIRDKLSQTNGAINQLRQLKQQLDQWAGRLKRAGDGGDQEAATLGQRAQSLQVQLADIEDHLIQTRNTNPFDAIRFPARLNARLEGLISVVAMADEAPTRQACELFDQLCAQVDAQLARLESLTSNEVAAFNELSRQGSVGVLGAPG